MIIMEAMRNVYLTTLNSENKETLAFVEDLLLVVKNWNSLYCLARTSVPEDEIENYEPFFVPFSECSRDAYIAGFLALHGCYKQAKLVLRNSLELLELSAFFALDPDEYDNWLESNDYHLPKQLPKKLAQKLWPDLEKKMRRIYGKLSRVAHSTSDETEFNRMTECTESSYCPAIEMAFLPPSSSQMEDVLSCAREIYILSLDIILVFFPKVMEYDDETLGKYFSFGDIIGFRNELKKAGVELDVGSITLDYEVCLEEKKKEST